MKKKSNINKNVVVLVSSIGVFLVISVFVHAFMLIPIRFSPLVFQLEKQTYCCHESNWSINNIPSSLGAYSVSDFDNKIEIAGNIVASVGANPNEYQSFMWLVRADDAFNNDDYADSFESFKKSVDIYRNTDLSGSASALYYHYFYNLYRKYLKNQEALSPYMKLTEIPTVTVKCIYDDRCSIDIYRNNNKVRDDYNLFKDETIDLKTQMTLSIQSFHSYKKFEVYINGVPAQLKENKSNVDPFFEYDFVNQLTV